MDCGLSVLVVILGLGIKFASGEWSEEKSDIRDDDAFSKIESIQKIDTQISRSAFYTAISCYRCNT